MIGWMISASNGPMLLTHDRSFHRYHFLNNLFVTDLPYTLFETNILVVAAVADRNKKYPKKVLNYLGITNADSFHFETSLRSFVRIG